MQDAYFIPNYRNNLIFPRECESSAAISSRYLLLTEDIPMFLSELCDQLAAHKAITRLASYHAVVPSTNHQPQSHQDGEYFIQKVFAVHQSLPLNGEDQSLSMKWIEIIDEKNRQGSSNQSKMKLVV